MFKLSYNRLPGADDQTPPLPGAFCTPSGHAETVAGHRGYGQDAEPASAMGTWQEDEFFRSDYAANGADVPRTTTR